MSGRTVTSRIRTQTSRFSPEDTRKTPGRTIPPKTGNVHKSRTSANTKTASKSKASKNNNGLTNNQRLLLGKKQLESGISPQKIPINIRRKIAREVGVTNKKNKSPEETVKKNYRPKVTFNQMAKLRNSQSNKNKKTIAVAMISAQKNVPGTQQIIPRNLNKTQALLKEKLKTISERSINVKETTHKFKGKDIVHDFMLMVWGDLKHDKLLTKDQYEFSKFLESGITKRFIGNNKIKFNKESDLVQKLLKYGIIKYTNKQQVDITLAGDVEQKHKKHFADLWKSGKPIHIPKRHIDRGISRLRKSRANTIHLCIDSESDLGTFSKLIENSLYVAKGGTKQQKFVKRFVTLPNLLDPGRGQNKSRGGLSKPGGLIDILQTKLFNSNQMPSTKFNLQKFTFKFGNVITIEITEQKSGFKYTLNGKDIKASVKRQDAGNSNTPGDKISKLFGDLMQILVVSAIESETNKNICGATFDGAFVGMSGYVQHHLFEQSPKLFVEDVNKIGAKNAKSGLTIYGFSTILNTPMMNNTQSGNNTERSATPRSKVPLPPRPAKRKRPSTPNKRVTWENIAAREKLEMLIRKRNLNNVFVNGYLKQYDNGKLTANQIIEKVDAAATKRNKLATYERKDTLRRRIR